LLASGISNSTRRKHWFCADLSRSWIVFSNCLSAMSGTGTLDLKLVMRVLSKACRDIKKLLTSCCAFSVGIPASVANSPKALHSTATCLPRSTQPAMCTSHQDECWRMLVGTVKDKRCTQCSKLQHCSLDCISQSTEGTLAQECSCCLSILFCMEAQLAWRGLYLAKQSTCVAESLLITVPALTSCFLA